MTEQNTPDNLETTHSNDALPWASQQRLRASKALLVGVYETKEQEPLAREHIQELELLAKTHKIPVGDSILLHVREFTAVSFVSKGKVEAIKERALQSGCSLIIFDDEISPSQQRNLEAECKIPVIDRTEVILGVFADRAKSHEAKMQVELARAQYLVPRLKRMWTHLSRQAGGGGGMSGGGYLKGEGEKQIEIDRRILKRRISYLAKEIKDVERYRTTQRSLREKSAVPVFAIVGYTNAGKSTLMQRLTGAEVFVEDMLFATLDTTTRRMMLPQQQEVLLIDTVGFIRKLPHQLVAAFKSTLEEAIQADFLIHMIDGSHPNALEQAKTTLAVLKELHAHDTPTITVINKIDQVETDEQKAIVQKLKMSYPRAVLFSAKTGEGMEALIAEMEAALQKGRLRLQIRIPQSRYDLVLETKKIGHLHSEEYVENDVLLDIDLPRGEAERLQSRIGAL